MMFCRDLKAKMLEWKEREHKNDDMAALHDPQARERSEIVVY
jgi:hypothetical protein